MANNYTQATVTPYLPASLFTDAELESLAYECGLSHDRIDDTLYIYAEEYFCEEGVDEKGRHWSCLAILQAKLKQLDPSEFPNIVIEGAATCNKMRSGEFGGFAYFITRDEIRHFSTWQWLGQQGTEADAQLRIMHAGPKLLAALQALTEATSGYARHFHEHQVAQAVILEVTGRAA